MIADELHEEGRRGQEDQRVGSLVKLDERLHGGGDQRYELINFDGWRHARLCGEGHGMSNQPELVGLLARFGAAVNIEFAVNISDMGLDGIVRHDQF